MLYTPSLLQRKTRLTAYKVSKLLDKNQTITQHLSPLIIVFTIVLNRYYVNKNHTHCNQKYFTHLSIHKIAYKQLIINDL